MLNVATRGSENRFEACGLSQDVSIAAGERIYLWRGAIIRPLPCRLWRIVHEAAYSMQLPGCPTRWVAMFGVQTA